ncbi:701_t:CDS:2, partial [Paraglomus occultum]
AATTHRAGGLTAIRARKAFYSIDRMAGKISVYMRCGKEFPKLAKLRIHLNRKYPCRSQDPMPPLQPAPEPANNENNLPTEPTSEVNQEKNNSDLEESWTEFLKHLGVKPDNSIPIENSNAHPYGQASSSTDVPQFHQTDIISSGCELLDDHYQVEIGKESIYAQDPINTLGVLREQIINIFNNRFDLTHGKNESISKLSAGVFDDKIEEDNGEKDYKEVPFKNKAVVVTSKEDIPRIVDELIWDIEKRIEVYVCEGSGWCFSESEDVNIEMPIYVPLTASSHLPLPKGLPKRNNGIINIKNEDDRCFEYCILADIFPAQHNRQRISWYTPHLGKLNFSGIQFPVKADNDTMEKFEKQNPDLSVSIYGWSEKNLIPIRIAPKSKVHDRCKHEEGDCQPRKLIQLLLITGNDPKTGEPAQHYCLIQGRDGLGKLAGYTTKHHNKLYVCDWCVSHRTHDLELDAKHMEDCAGINNPPQRTEMPKEGKNIYKFKRIERMMDAPFTCYVDTEGFTQKINENRGTNTTAIQEHKPAGLDYVIVRSDGHCKPPVQIRGEDPAGDFIKAMGREVELMWDYLASGHIIRDSAEKLSELTNAGFLCHKAPKEMHLKLLFICKHFKSWKLSSDKNEKKGEINWVTDVRHSLKKIYEMHKTKPLGNDVGKMYRLISQIYQRLRWPGEPMKKLTKEEENQYNSAKVCWICNEAFDCGTTEDNRKKVRDHDHITGKYRGPAHSICNLQLRIKPEETKLLIRFHNMEKYDAHFIAKAMGRVSQEEISAIPHNMENYLSFDIGYQRYMDSYHIMSSSLDSLVANLGAEPCPNPVDEEGKPLDVPCKKPGHLYRIGDGRHPERFPITRAFAPKGRSDLVFRKGKFPYDWFDSPERFDETSLPRIEAFNSILNKSACTLKDYERAQEVWDAFGMKTFREYHDLYLKLDVLLLADVFEANRKMMKAKFGLDIAHYVSLPSFAEDALYKMTGQKIELLTDDNMYLFCENGIRGGISMASKRKAIANNPKCPGYDPKKPTTWLLYLDANALYTGSMMKYMPTGVHRWINSDEIPDLFSRVSKCEIPDDAPKGYMLEVDLEYPDKLHKSHTAYPLAPESLEISKEEMAKYQQDLITKLGHYTKTKKLVPNLNNKEKYVVHYRALQCYIRLGMRLTKIHRAIEFDQSPWMKPFMEELARSRALATNDFEKAMYKLLGNANYGKTVENVRKYQKIDFVRPQSESKKFKRLVADPSYKSHRILAENLVGINRHQSKVKLSKPIFVGQSVLDESKVTMYNFYYNVMKARYGDKVDLAYTDTDSLILHIQTEDVYKDMAEMHEYFDFSEYPPEHELVKNLPEGAWKKNKKVPGKFKDECNGIPMWKGIFLRPKQYSYILANEKSDRRAKGVQKVVVKKNLTHDMYDSCLQSQKEHMVTMHRLGSKDHVIRLLRSSKIGLSPLDTKRWILSDGITTLAFGDCRIRAYKNLVKSGMSHEDAEKRTTYGV